MHWHTKQTDKVLEELKVSPHGLSEVEAARRLKETGENELDVQGPPSPIWLFLNQFKDFMILVLIAVAIISGFIGDVADTIIIGVIVLMNAIIGFIQEYKAEASIRALKQMAALHAHVIRNGKLQLIPAQRVVPGDIVQMEAGSVIPADLRLLEVHSFRVNESALTGESVPVDKSSDSISGTDISIGDQTNMAFKSTLVINGRATGVVTATGMRTEIGKIAGLLTTKKQLTPLQKRMAGFTKLLSYAILLLCLVLFIAGILRGEEPVKMLLLAISLAVAAIPEALPALITVCLSLGARRMVKQQALVRNLPAVETLGSVNFICTDKTGTLTENKMKVEKIHILCDETVYEQYNPLILALALNNDLKKTEEGIVTGDPTEIALVDYVQHHLSHEAFAPLKSSLPRVAEIPFDAERKLMTTIHSLNKRFLILTKGAPESIADHLTDSHQAELLLQQSHSWSAEGMRVLAFAYKITDTIPSLESAETHLHAAGVTALIDPPRPAAKQAIAECSTAGIQTVMITGDHLATATAIATDLGIMHEGDLARSSEQLKQMSSETFQKEVEKIRVYARVSPEQKLMIIKALQKKNHFVSMTGDGVNDAPSLKAANIGVAMGINGTDVSKEAADMILLDDNFSTIVKAVKEGRRIYDNIRKFIKYIMTCNTAEILIMLLAPLLQLPIPLLPVHILWINLVTDGLPGLALASERSEKLVMKLPPRKPEESLFADGVGAHIIRISILMAGVTLAMQAWAVHQKLEHWQTMVFVTLSFAQLGHILAIKSNRNSVFSKDILSNMPLLLTVIFTCLLQIAIVYLPFANQLLKTQPLTLNELLWCFIFGSVVLFAVELEKWIFRIRLKKMNLY